MTTATPLVSIVTPTLNRRALLAETLASVSAQSYRNLEHIVVDGGSTDGTLEMLASTGSVRWVSEPDGGMYEAINKGLGMANGEILAYLNSDDRYFPWTIETIVEAFARHPDADFIYGDALNVNVTGGVKLILQPPFTADYVRLYGLLCQPTVFWRRAVLEEEGGFDERLQYVADCEYWMRLGDRRRFVHVSEFVAVELDHPSTKRSTGLDALDAELHLVRSRYGNASTRMRVWGAVWYRWNMLRFAVRSGTRRIRPNGSWRHYLATGVRVSWLELALTLVPRIGLSHREHVVQPNPEVHRRSASR